jgi:hypothetical protein
MNDLTKTFICSSCSFSTQPLYEHLHKCESSTLYVMSDISSHDSISMMIFFFSFSLLKTWYCVEHAMSGITNLLYVEQEIEETQKNKFIKTKTYSLSFIDSKSSNIYYPIIDIIYVQKNLDIHIIPFYFYF